MSTPQFQKLLGPTRYETAFQMPHKRRAAMDGEGLCDVLDGPQGDDARIRPNQILTVSLPHSPLEPPDQAAVVRVVGARLATSYGLRTLDPDDPAYVPCYTGDVPSRDAAYHQGPAWAWLLPHYALAVHRVTGDAVYAQSLLEPMADHLADAGLGTVSELFDAEPPHTPRGAPSQAWSVACTLDAWCRLEQARRSTQGHRHVLTHRRHPMERTRWHPQGTSVRTHRQPGQPWRGRKGVLLPPGCHALP